MTLFATENISYFIRVDECQEREREREIETTNAAFYQTLYNFLFGINFDQLRFSIFTIFTTLSFIHSRTFYN